MGFLNHKLAYSFLASVALQRFDAVGWMAAWQEGHLACKKTEWWGEGMAISVGRGVDLHVAQLMQLPLTVSCFSKI